MNKFIVLFRIAHIELRSNNSMCFYRKISKRVQYLNNIAFNIIK